MTGVAAPVMIYHAPYPLDRASVSGSGIRPVRMRDAFEAEGYEVWEVTGHSRERAARIREVKRRIREGARPAFVYSESSTMPTPLTDPHHLPVHLWLDASFLRFCREHGAPTGIFYRDIYWQFPEYLNAVYPLIARGTRFFYRRDLRLYRKAMDRIFLPSDRMAQYLPVENRAQCTPLPPGADSIDEPRIAHEGIELLFVGSLGDYYKAHECVRGAALAQNAHLTICTREAQWQALRHEYESLLGGTTDVVHRSGEGLLPLFAAADVGVLFLEPIEYREFAVPIKLFEYLGHGKPIVATEGTMVGEFVAAHGIGWVIPYEAQALADLLDRLVAHPEELATMSERCRQVRGDHTWRARARQAAEALGKAAS